MTEFNQITGLFGPHQGHSDGRPKKTIRSDFKVYQELKSAYIATLE